MILLEPANTILYNSIEDQAADHLINGVIGNEGRCKRQMAVARDVSQCRYALSPKRRCKGVRLLDVRFSFGFVAIVGAKNHPADLAVG